MTTTITSIHDACRQGDINTVRALVAADPANVDADDEHAWHPIFHACLYRHTEIVRFLIGAGADLAAHGGYVLHYAAEVPDNKNIVAMLVQYGAMDAHVRPPNDLSRQFLAAVYLADETRVRSLLSRFPQLATMPDGWGDQPIHHAARNGDTEIIRLLIDYGADVNAMTDRGHTVLYCAGGHGHLDALHLLLDKGVDIETKFTNDGMTLLEWLAQYPSDERFVRITEALTQHQMRA